MNILTTLNARKILLSILTITTFGFGARAQLPTSSFFEYEFTGGSLNNTSSSGAPNFTGSITSIADRNGSVNDAADITGALGGASIGATNVNEMTLSFWMKHDPITSNERILQIYGTGGKGFRLQMTGSQLLYDAAIGGGGSSSISNVETATVNIDNSVWHHIVVRTTLINANTVEFDVFLDNVLVPSLSNTTLDIQDYAFSLSITNFLMNANLTISPTNNYSGDIDDIYFYKSALTDAQITQLYNYSPLPCTVNIPDANFKAYLVGNTAINTNSDTEIQCSEASAFTGILNCSNLSISDLTGIETFTALTELYCSNNSLTSLDVTQNTALTDLGCGANTLSSLDVTQNTALTLLYCQVNSISSLDVTQNTALTNLLCQGNSLSSLDITQNTALTKLLCAGSSLTSLDVSNNTSLTELDCGSSSLSSLDVTQNTVLTKLYCNQNSLTTLNVANGNNSNFSSFFANNNPSLSCITVDDVAYSTTNWTIIDAQTSFSTNCGTVGINDLFTVNGLSVYPNPVKNNLFIEVENQDFTNINIIDFSGKTAKLITDSNTKNIDVSDLSQGIYVLKVSTKSGVLTNRFIKQ
jgi:hypothetical protein